jgi:hypothetical protein
MARWIITYGDGATFSDEDGAPDAAPGLDVQIIAQADPDVGRRLLRQFDYYLWDADAGEWLGVDLFGLIDQLVARGVVKAGRTLPNAAYQALYLRASSDPRLPAKSARHWLEQPPPGEVDRP